MPADDNFRWLDSDEESLLFDNEKLIGRVVKDNSSPCYLCYNSSAPSVTEEQLVFWCSDPGVAKFELMRRIRAQRYIPDQVRSEDANAG